MTSKLHILTNFLHLELPECRFSLATSYIDDFCPRCVWTFQQFGYTDETARQKVDEFREDTAYQGPVAPSYHIAGLGLARDDGFLVERSAEEIRRMHADARVGR